ncbi:MAG: BMP family ABC transporter substrate-binding protein [Chlorobiaceae bacterium]|jgi:basic membrane protein A and related proteins|nr:BMP family ABC transporter substrate-binding protein [Chlorobiaceae bacterium]NTV15895.1 BMP family ABC transporter substrate-binding protein [Chlorobiaceae bacterium]
MKHSFSLFLCFLCFLAGCSGQNKEKKVNGDSSDGKLQIGLVFDVGGRGDKSFNDSAYNGLELAKAKHGINFLFIEPQGEGADREAALRQMAVDPDIGLIIGVGMLFSEDITAIASEFPNKKFVCIDYIHQPEVVIPSNLQGIVFEEKKGSFLAGALAALVTKTKTVGFIGGMESSVIKKFESGFIEGVRSINPGVNVISGYIGMTGSAFANPAKGKELALGQYGKGADIIYQAAGASGLGVIEAARESKALVICTDRDQQSVAPGFVLSTMTKAVDRAVLKTVETVLDGSFKGGGVSVFGLADRYTDYVYNEKNASLIGLKNHQQLEEIRKKIIEGKIVVDETAVEQ